MGVLWDSGASLDGLCGSHTHGNRRDPRIRLFPLALPDVCGVILDGFPSTIPSPASPSFGSCSLSPAGKFYRFLRLRRTTGLHQRSRRICIRIFSRRKLFIKPTSSRCPKPSLQLEVGIVNNSGASQVILEKKTFFPVFHWISGDIAQAGDIQRRNLLDILRRGK